MNNMQQNKSIFNLTNLQTLIISLLSSFTAIITNHFYPELYYLIRPYFIALYLTILFILTIYFILHKGEIKE
jgi:hypothetical protein